MTITIGRKSLVAPREHETTAVVQKEAIVYYGHVGRFLAVATDRVDVSITYIATHVCATHVRRCIIFRRCYVRACILINGGEYFTTYY